MKQLTRKDIVELINNSVTTSPLVYSTTKRSGSNGIRNPEEITTRVLRTLEQAGVLMLVDKGVKEGDLISLNGNTVFKTVMSRDEYYDYDGC